MTTILKTRKLWSVVEEGVAAPPAQVDETPETARERSLREEAMMNDTLALQIMLTAVSDHIFSRIAAASTSKEAWDALNAEYEGSPQVRLIRLQTLRREYDNLKMYENEDIKVFTDKIVELANQLTYHGEQKTDVQLIQKILISLPAKFDSIMAELIGILKAHEARLAAREESTSERAFDARVRHKNSGVRQDNSKRRGGKKWCGYCKKNNHTECESLKKQKKDDPKKDHISNKECYNCGKLGHFANQCYSKKKEKAHLSLEEDLNEDHMLFRASEAATTVMEDVWLVYSGESNHMTKEENYFSRLDRSIKVPIKIGNGSTVMTA
uniref:CCHC-type domain-containing protein n=1 Tax=Brassica oleracea var. oleracea TaxID=109376 RepID=A0A0D3BMR6_BRAOL